MKNDTDMGCIISLNEADSRMKVKTLECRKRSFVAMQFNITLCKFA